jgi:hypothetical protein
LQPGPLTRRPSKIEVEPATAIDVAPKSPVIFHLRVAKGATVPRSAVAQCVLILTRTAAGCAQRIERKTVHIETQFGDPGKPHG